MMFDVFYLANKMKWNEMILREVTHVWRTYIVWRLEAFIL